LEAVTPPTDAAWMGQAKWRNVVVRASSAAHARMVAAALEPRAAVGNESLAQRDCFENEKLYWVRQIHAGEWNQNGPDAILASQPFTP
jgi:hypothetical protein